jgi:exodeoxyribonuclease VII small subunit
MADKPKPEVAGMSFEAALQELEQVVARLESGDVALEESIALYGRGAELKRHCEKKLNEAEEKVAQITEGADGTVTARPIDPT